MGCGENGVYFEDHWLFQNDIFVETRGKGNVFISGISNRNDGVFMGNGTNITTKDGDINVEGIGPNSNFGKGGIALYDTTITCTGIGKKGSIRLMGNGGYGVLIDGHSNITSANNFVTINGRSNSLFGRDIIISDRAILQGRFSWFVEYVGEKYSKF